MTTDEIMQLPIGPEAGKEPIAIFFEKDEPMATVDDFGIMWRIGKYKDGTFFRKRS